MGWSIRLFDVAGTAVRIHLTFFLLLAWIAAIHWSKGGAAEAIDGVLFIVACSCAWCCTNSVTCLRPAATAFAPPT